MKETIKILIICGLFLYSLYAVCNADVYIVTNSQGNVYDISNQPDIVVPVGDTQTILKGQLVANLPILPPYQNYNYIKGAFSLNTTVVQAEQAAQAAAIAAQTTLEQNQASAIQKLTDAISKVSTADVLTAAEMSALLPAVNVSIGTTQP